jgi:hypothetical protein
MFLKSPKIREFNYQPRFYKPTSSGEAQGEKRIKFRRLSRRKPATRRSFMGMIIILIALIFLVQYLFKIAFDNEKNAPIEELKIEIID